MDWLAIPAGDSTQSLLACLLAPTQPNTGRGRARRGDHAPVPAGPRLLAAAALLRAGWRGVGLSWGGEDWMD